ncbi:hypothetical protein ACIBL6_08965 [Streptomyces sp. NPDC050400]|uniref:hypothetical protein n=1 Tax=Streptomyces sp. NPDC050400 TaxID=3365610 RepID=UPI00378B7402
MQADDARARGEEAGEWLRERFEGGDPEPKISINWVARDDRDDAGFARLLKALFTPIRDEREP